MMNIKSKLLRACLWAVSASALSLAAANAQAEDAYPSKPIRLIIPFGPGGVTDLTARAFAKSMSETLKQPIVTENKPGAGAIIGANYVARSAPDGYTMLLGTNVTHAISPQLLKATPYDPLKDFEPIAFFGLNGNALVVKNTFPANTFDEFIAYLRAKKGDVNYASGSIGSSAHLAAELLKQEVSGLQYTHVPYPTPGEAMTGLLSGQVDFMFANIGQVTSLIRAGKVKAIAVTTAKREPELPNVPTVAESVPGFEVVGWIAAFVPRGTPPEIVARLNQAINQAQNDPELRKVLDPAGVIPVIDTPQQTAEFVRSEYEKWGRVIRNAHIPKM